MAKRFNWNTQKLEEYNKKTQSDGSTASYYELPENATELQELISETKSIPSGYKVSLTFS